MTAPTLLALAERLDAHATLMRLVTKDGQAWVQLHSSDLQGWANVLTDCGSQLRALAAPQVEMVSDVPGLLEMSDLLRRVGVETKSFHDQKVAEAAYRAGYQAALNARAGGDGWLELLEAAKQASATLGHIYHTTPIGGALEQHAHDGYQRLDAATRAIDAALASQAVGVGS